MMVSTIFRIIGYLFGLVAFYAIWLDITAREASIVLGQFWSNHHLESLLIGEAIVSRYIDPCGLIVQLGCEPFLWHPVVVTLLSWPAALVLLLCTAFFCSIARLFRRRQKRRADGASLKRRGTR